MLRKLQYLGNEFQKESQKKIMASHYFSVAKEAP